MKFQNYLTKEGLQKGVRYLLTHQKLFYAVIVCVGVFWGGHFLMRLYGQFKANYINVEGLRTKLRGVEVGVVPVKKDTVPVYLSFVGTTSSVQKVDIRARVKGFLTEVHFKEGDNVKTGDLMFVIDESEYRTAVNQLTAQIEKDQANLDFANEQVVRYGKLVDKEYVSREAYDQYVTSAKQAKASLDASNASLDKAKLDLGYCRMYSPIDGRVGRVMVHIGNLVGATEETVLATVVQLDPMYVYFYPSEQQYREITEYQTKNKLKVDLAFSDGSKYPDQGEVDFIDNTANQQTNTVAMRAVFPNKNSLMLPDVYVNASLLLDEQPDTLLIPQKAIMQGQEGPHIYVVDNNGMVDEKLVDVGFSYKDMAAIDKGVEEGEKVIVDGIQKVRQGMKVRTRDVR